MKISVIVCTYNRAHAIIPCLDSIAASLAHTAPVDAEIVVVDNNSKDNTSAAVKKWAETCAFPVRLVLESKQGISSARNCGLKTSKGDLIIFTDDDCRLSKEYVSEALRHDSADTELVLRGGRVELGDPDDLPLTILTSTVSARWSRKMKSARRQNIGDSIFGCNMMMRRAVIDRLGYFDEYLGAGTSIPAGEDTDYLFRAYLSDIVIEYVPDMVLSHYHGRREKSEGVKLFRNYMMGQGAFQAKYFFRDPNLCRPFYWDIKNAVKEIVMGKNTFMTDMNFSHKDKVSYCIKGFYKYVSSRIRASI